MQVQSASAKYNHRRKRSYKLKKQMQALFQTQMVS